MRSLLFFLLTTTAIFLAAWTFTHGPAEAGNTAPQPPKDYDPIRTRLNDEGDTGQLVYLRYCSGCHGVNGDGRGPASAFLAPRPRDFTAGIYKFTSTPANSPPLVEDLLRTITEGLHGTSMPSWRLLPMNERESLARYILAFHKEWEFRTPQPAVPFHENPVDMTDHESLEKAIQQGREIYHKKTTCWSCHPSYLSRVDLEALTGNPGRDDLDKSLAKPDQWGETILPPDFSRDALKSVGELKDLYRAITAGIGGTAMPTWKGVLTREELWPLVLYVDSLRPEPFSTTKRAIKRIKEAEAK